MRLIPFRSLLVIAILASLGIASALARQTDTAPVLEISVAGASCSLTLGGLTDPSATPEVMPQTTLDNTPVSTPEVTPEASGGASDSETAYPTFILGDGCDSVTTQLRAASNGTVWVAISSPDESAWLKFETISDDPHPPSLDGRGRFVGCKNGEQGDQTCRVTTTIDGVEYEIRIPFTVGSRYDAPAPTARPAAVATLAPTSPPAAPQPPQGTEEVH